MPKRTYIRAGGVWVDATTGAGFPASSIPPSTPQTGQVYFDTDDQKPYIWNGTAWILFAPNITDSTSTTSSTIAASATAVKAAYDLAASHTHNTVSINAQTGTTYTLVLGDAGKLITLGNAASITLTIPLNATVAFPVGTSIDLLQILAGQVTVAITATGVLNTFDSRTKLGGQWAAATIIKTDTNTWALIGNVTS